MKHLNVRARAVASVQTDWYGWLPDAKLQAFRVYVGEFEASYGMLVFRSMRPSVSVIADRLAKSFQVVFVTPALCKRLTAALEGMLCSLEEHAKHYGVVPSVAPLDASNFNGQHAHHSALMSSLLSRMFSQRAQFLSKIGTLRDMVADLDNEFPKTWQRAFGDGIRPLWSAWALRIQYLSSRSHDPAEMFLARPSRRSVAPLPKNCLADQTPRNPPFLGSTDPPYDSDRGTIIHCLCSARNVSRDARFCLSLFRVTAHPRGQL